MTFPERQQPTKPDPSTDETCVFFGIVEIIDRLRRSGFYAWHRLTINGRPDQFLLSWVQGKNESVALVDPSAGRALFLEDTHDAHDEVADAAELAGLEVLVVEALIGPTCPGCGGARYISTDDGQETCATCAGEGRL